MLSFIKYLLTGFFIFFLIVDNYAQDLTRAIAEYEIIYSYSIDRSGVDQDRDIPPNFIKMAKAAEEIASNLEGRLIFSNKNSVYWSPEGVARKNKEDGLANILVSADQKYYYSHPQGILYIEKMMFGKKSHFKDDRIIVWEVLSDQTVINGLVCRKAIGTFKTEGWNDTEVKVWFALDLPFPFGPVDTYDLPGVILKYQLASLVITARSIRRIPDKSEEIVIPDFGDVPSFSESVR